MGWIWRDEPEDVVGGGRGDVSVFGLPETKVEDRERFSTRKTVKSQCKTEEVEPGKFIRKCEKTEEVLQECLGRPAKVVQSSKEYTEEDVTDEMLNKKPSAFTFKHSDESPFNFPGLRGDIESIEHGFFNNIHSFFEAADEIKNGFFSAFGTPYFRDCELPSSSARRGIPIEDFPPKQPSAGKAKTPDSGSIDLSGLARDV